LRQLTSLHKKSINQLEACRHKMRIDWEWYEFYLAFVRKEKLAYQGKLHSENKVFRQCLIFKVLVRIYFKSAHLGTHLHAVIESYLHAKTWYKPPVANYIATDGFKVPIQVLFFVVCGVLFENTCSLFLSTLFFCCVERRCFLSVAIPDK
jgi:hypothetical protein